MKTITNKPVTNSRLTTSRTKAGIAIEFKIFGGSNKHRAKHHNRLGVTTTTLLISPESAKSLAEHLSYHVTSLELDNS